jgi:hypothetical protein
VTSCVQDESEDPMKSQGKIELKTRRERNALIRIYASIRSTMSRISGEDVEGQ